MGDKRNATLREIPLDQIDPPHFEMHSYMLEDKFNELVSSIKAEGVIEPLIVKPKDDRYQVALGDRRYEAAKKAGMVTVPCIIRDLGEGEAERIKLHENFAREGLNPYDTAVFLDHYMRREKITQAELGEHLGWTQQRISYYLVVVRMPPDLQEALRDRGITLRHAHSLAKIDDAEQRKFHTQLVVEGGASTRTLEGWVQDYLRDKGRVSETSPGRRVKETPTPPPPVQTQCFWCEKSFPPESLVMVPLDSDCHALLWQVVEEAKRRRQEEMAPEAGDSQA